MAAERLEEVAFSITLRQLIAISGRRKWPEDRLQAFGEAMLNSSFPDTVQAVADAVVRDERESIAAHLREHDERLARGE